MAKIRKLNVSETVGRSPFEQDDEAIMPSGTVVVYEKNNNGVIEYVLRVHDGVTNGGVAISPGPGPVIFNGSEGIVPSNLNEGIAALFNNGDVYITGGESLRFTGIGEFEGNSTAVLRFWDNEGRHSTGNDPTELVTLNVGNDAAEGDPTEGFFKIVTEKEADPGNEKEWKFDANGVLTLPTGGDIVDSTGASVLGSGVSIDRNIWIQTFATDSDPDKAALASSVEYDSLGNVYALFLHQIYDNIENPSTVTGSYFSVAKFASTGEKLWSVRSTSANVFTDGWGLAVDNANSAFYVAGKTDVAESYSRSFLVKFNSDDGSQVWASTLDFGNQSDSPVVDIASDGNPVIVGYLETGNDGSDGVTVTKIDRTDGSILWSQLLDGQGDDEAYGMAVGPNGEIVAVGYTSQIGVTDAADGLYADLAGNLNWTVSGSINSNGVTADFTFTDGFPTFTNIVDTVGGRTVDDTIVTVLGSTIGGADGTDDMVVKVETVAANDTTARMLVVKYDYDGVIQWQKAIQFDAGYDCYGADADIDVDGNVYINGNWRYDSGQAPFPTSAMSIVKFDSNGAAQWSRRVVGDCDDFTTSIVVGPENTLYLTGVTTRLGDTDKYIWVVAKYTTSGSVIWQRLIENNSQWSFSGGFFGSSGGGSSLAVKEGYVALSGAFGVPFDGASTATLIQLDFDGTVFTVGDWEVKVASFSGNLSSDASDITVINAGKTDTAIEGDITVSNTAFSFDSGNFLVPTLYRAPGGGDSLVNGAYSVVLGSTGTVTLPAGGTITEGVVTSNPTIQLTPATPIVASQKLVIKGGAQYSVDDNGIFLTWNEINPLVSDTVTIFVGASAYTNQTLYWWINPAEAGIADPGFGTVEIDEFGSGSFTFTVDSDDYEFTVRVSPENNNYDPASIGVETLVFNADAPTYGDHHLHLTTGDLTETSIIVGTDDHNVRTTVNGGVEINTFLYPDGGGSAKWIFDNNGVLTFPDNAGKINPAVSDGPGLQVEADADFEIKVAQTFDAGTPGETTETAVWSFESNGSITFPDATVQTTAYTGGEASGVVIPAGGTVVFEFGTDFTSTIIGDFGNGSGYIRVESVDNNFSQIPISTEFYNFLTTLTEGTQFTVNAVDNGTTYNTVVSFTQFAGGNPASTTRNDLYYTFVSGDVLPFTYGATELTLTFETNAFSFTNSAVTFPDGTVQSTAFVRGQHTFTFDEVVTTYEPITIDFNLLYLTPNTGYAGSDPVTVTLPIVGAGTRILVLSTYNNSVVTVNTIATLNPGVVAEFVFVDGEGWVLLYGATLLI